MRTRSRSAKKSRDEIEFPIRVRYLLPDQGRSLLVDAIHAWLDAEVGRSEYAFNADSQPGAKDATSYYFRRLEDAKHFIEFMTEAGGTLADPRTGGFVRMS